MVLMRFFRFRLLAIVLLCILKVSFVCAKDFSELNQTPYLQTLTDDNLQYAWRLYTKSVDWQEKAYPSLCFALSEEAERIFNRRMEDCDFSWHYLEIALRNLEISLSRNRRLIDKDEEGGLEIASIFNLLKVSTNLVRVKTILENHPEQPDSLHIFYSNWFQKCKARYLSDCALYRIKKGEMQKALTSSEEALDLIQCYDTCLLADVTCQKRTIQYLMQPSVGGVQEAIDGLRQLVSPVFIKDEILCKGTLPLFYLCVMQIARRYEEKGDLTQAIQTYRLLLIEIRKYLNKDIPYLLAEEKKEIGLLLQYYLDTVQHFSLRHIEYGPVSELLLDYSLLKEDILSIGPSPICQTEEGRQPLIVDLQQAIDSIYTASDYYLLPGNPLYFNKFQLQTELMALKRKQVSLIKNKRLLKNTSVEWTDWNDLKKYLEPHEALVKIIDLPINFFDRQYVALVVTSDSSSPGMVLLPKKRALLRILLKNQETEKIWNPIYQFLGNRKDLYFCLEGDLIEFQWSNISFQKKKLLDIYNLHYLLSTSDFVKLKQEQADSIHFKRDLYGFGGAYFSAPPSLKGMRGQGAQYLPGSRKELCRIDTMLPEGWKSHLFLGREANKSNFLQLSFRTAPHSVIHIATHGFSLLYDETVSDGRIVSFKENSWIGTSAYKDPMMRHGFLLTGANRFWNKPVPYDAIDSGIVTAYDVSQMNLFGTDLVILSACRSASGETKDGEGLFGLIRAFKVAGAKAVLANVNNISDSETISFITTFYRYWMEGNNMFDAFCRTQRELMNVDPENEFLWTGFVLFE